MLMIGNPTPDLEVEALMPDGRFERLRLGSLTGRWAVLFFYPKDFTFVCPTEIRGYEAFAPGFARPMRRCSARASIRFMCIAPGSSTGSGR